MAFNKMFVMLPVMLAARKLDGENPDTVFMLRCAYGTVQAVIVLLVAYIYISSLAVSNGKDKDRLIYVPPPPVVSLSWFHPFCADSSGFILPAPTKINTRTFSFVPQCCAFIDSLSSSHCLFALLPLCTIHPAL